MMATHLDALAQPEVVQLQRDRIVSSLREYGWVYREAAYHSPSSDLILERAFNALADTGEFNRRYPYLAIRMDEAREFKSLSA
jgi:hypothetical protein